MNLRTLSTRLRHRLRHHVLDAIDARGLVRGMRVEFSRAGRSALESFEAAMPGPGEVLVETVLTLISPGTERAIFSGKAAPADGFPHIAGYSQVGIVVARGPGASLEVGQLVSTAGAHASLHVCGVDRAIPVPAGVPVEAAVMTQIGFIAIQGVRRAAVQPGERVAVFGAGLIGQLAAQIARVAGGEVAVVARTPARLAIARACGFDATVDILARPEDVNNLQADVVIEATGDPQAIHGSIRAVAQGARTVLLGSPRGVTQGLDLGTLARDSLTLVGAHTSVAPVRDESPRAWTWRRECLTFLALAAQGRLALAPLVSHRRSPGEATHVYEELSRPGDASVGVVFDWTLPGPWRSRIERAGPARLAIAGVRRLTGSAPAPVPLRAPRRDGRRLRFGLIGCGEIASESAAALRQATNGAITYACDPARERAQAVAAASGAQATDAVEELLASADVDAVLISTPHHLHAPLAIQAAQAGKHVVVEKPMATSVADCDRMIAAATAAGVLLSVCYCQRFDPRVQRAHQLLAAGALGEILGTRILFGQLRTPEYFRSGISGRSENDWRANRTTAGGGVLMMNACHILDYVSWLVGSPIREVAACVANLGGAAEVEDSVSLSYRYEQGALGTLEATTTLVGPHAYEQALRGRDGQLVIAPTLRVWSRRTVDGYEAGRWHTVRSLPRAAERKQYFEAFADAVLDQGVPPVTAAQGRAVQAAIEAAYLAAESGRTVTVAPPPATDLPRRP